ncbi:MAG: hemolysin family protein [Anaerolineaceae bacterium]|jgi:putative hemolysin
MSIVIEILVIFLLILLNGMFSMFELAMVSSKKPKLEQAKAEGDIKAAKALELLEKPNKFLSTVQIGISLISILSGAFGGANIAMNMSNWLVRQGMNAGLADALSLTIVVLFITFFSIVIGELIPKRIALNDPEGVARSLSGFMSVVSNLSNPLIKLLDWSTELGIKILGIKPSNEPTVSEEEIRLMIAEGRSTGVFNQAEQDYVEGVFRFTERRVDALMTPRGDIDWIDLDDPREMIVQTIRQSKFSRLPLAKDNLDEFVGMIDTKDLVGLDLYSEDVDFQLLAHDTNVIPENSSALNAFEQFRDTGVHDALVIDEYGSVIGMVTLFDVLESIVGDIPVDETDTDIEVVEMGEESWSLDGMLPIDELKELLHIENLPEEEKAGYNTLSGLVMYELGSIPKIGDSFDIDDFSFHVTDIDGLRVDRVEVTRILPEESKIER